MAFSINDIELLGNVGAIETRQSGELKIANLRLATSEGGYKTREGKDIPLRTDWHTLVCFGRDAERAEKHIQKGDRLLVKGKLTYNEYTDKNGVRRTSAEIICRELYFFPRTAAEGRKEAAEAGSAADSVGGGFGGTENLPF